MSEVVERLAYLEAGHQQNKSDIDDLKSICRNLEKSILVQEQSLIQQERACKQNRSLILILAVEVFANNPQIISLIKSLFI